MIATANKTKQIYLFFFTALLLTACGRSKKIDVSNINVNIKIERFDHDFNAMRHGPMPKQAAYLEDKYGVFYKDYVEQIIQAGRLVDTNYYGALRGMFAAQSYNDLKHDVDSVYPNVDKQNAELTDAFKHIKYYFPKQNIPKVYAYFSGFTVQTSIGNGYLGIGLDMFLGANSRFYPALTEAFPRYLSRFFTPDNITPRAVEVFAREEMFPEHEDNPAMLNKMIYNGKILYFMDAVLPDVPDSTKIDYTTLQLNWCKANESNIWRFFLDQNLLYETDNIKIQRYINVAPFTPGLGEKNESAPRLGIWTGWQIVRKYMENHPDITLAELMADNDAQKILAGAKYKPDGNKQ